MVSLPLKKPRSFAQDDVIRFLICKYVAEEIYEHNAHQERYYTLVFGKKKGIEKIYDLATHILREYNDYGDENTLKISYYGNGSLRYIKNYYRGKLHGYVFLYCMDNNLPFVENYYYNGHLRERRIFKERAA